MNKDYSSYNIASQRKDAGFHFYQAGEFEKAAMSWEEGLTLVEEMSEPDPSLQGMLLCNLGIVYSKLDREIEAIQCYERAIEQSVPEETACFLGKAYMGLGQAYRKMNDLSNAVASTEKALLVFESQDDPLMMEKVRVNCAMLHRDLGNKEEARRLLQSAYVAFDSWNRSEEAAAVALELEKLKWNKKSIALPSLTHVSKDSRNVQQMIEK